MRPWWDIILAFRTVQARVSMYENERTKKRLCFRSTSDGHPLKTTRREYLRAYIFFAAFYSFLPSPSSDDDAF